MCTILSKCMVKKNYFGSYLHANKKRVWNSNDPIIITEKVKNLAPRFFYPMHERIVSVTVLVFMGTGGYFSFMIKNLKA